VGGTGGVGGSGTQRGGAGGTIEVGFHYNADQAAAYAAFGVKNSAPADEKAEINAFVSYINAHGGVGGRQIAPVLLGVDEGSGTWSATAQSSCDFFTQDHHVAVVLSTARPYADLPFCLASRRTPVMIEYDYLYDYNDYARMGGYLFQPSSLSPSRWKAWIDGLYDGGYFDPGSRIGLIRFDDTPRKRISDTVIKPALASHHLALTDEAATASPNSQSDIAAVAAQLGNIALRFRSENIDHVLFLGTGGSGPFFFLPLAESQGFHPRYGLNSNEMPDLINANVPAAQLRRAMSVGWWPMRDVSAAKDPGSPMEALCVDILRRAGVAEPSHYALGTAMLKCDDLFFLKTALDRAGDVSPGALRGSVEGLGTSYQSPNTFSTRFGPGRADGAASVRISTFDDGCACFVYSSGPRPAP
jgi:hypothetical protein